MGAGSNLGRGHGGYPHAAHLDYLGGVMLTSKEVQDLRERFQENRGYPMAPEEAYAFWCAALDITCDIFFEEVGGA